MLVDRHHSMDKMLRNAKLFQSTMVHTKQQLALLVCIQRAVHWAGYQQPDTPGASPLNSLTGNACAPAPEAQHGNQG